MGRRNWTRCIKCNLKLNIKSFEKSHLQTCESCHRKQMKKMRKVGVK